MAASLMIASRPGTPVVATAVAKVPRYERPVIATLPLHQVALIVVPL